MMFSDIEIESGSNFPQAAFLANNIPPKNVLSEITLKGLKSKKGAWVSRAGEFDVKLKKRKKSQSLDNVPLPPPSPCSAQLESLYVLLR